MSFSFENFGGGSDWGISFDFGSTFDFLDVGSWLDSLGITEATGRNPAGDTVNLGSQNHSVITYGGGAGDDIVTVSAPGSTSTTTYSSGSTTAQSFPDGNQVDFARWTDANNPSLTDRIINSVTSLSPLDVVEGVARLAIPGGGLIIDTAENLIAGQDPFTAVINAAQEGVDRVVNFAGDAFDTARDTAIAVYDSVSDPIGTSRAVTTTVVDASDSAIQTITVTGQRVTTTATAVVTDPIGTLTDLTRFTVNTGTRVVDTAVTAVTNVANTVGNIARGDTNVSTVLAAVSDSLGISGAVEAASNLVAQATVSGLSRNVQAALESAYENFVSTGNTRDVNRILADNNLTREAVGLLYPTLTAADFEYLITRGVVFGQPSENLIVVATGESTTVTSDTVTQANTINSVTAVTSDSQNNAAAVNAEADSIATVTANSISAVTQAAIVAAYDSALATGNFAQLNALLAANNLDRLAVKKLFPNITDTELDNLVSRGLVFGQPANDAASNVNNGTAGGGASNNGSTTVVDDIVAGIGDINAGITNVTNVINNAAAIPASLLGAAQAAADALASAQSLATITIPEPVLPDLIGVFTGFGNALGQAADNIGDLFSNQNATLQQAQEQATLQDRYNQAATGDWRVRLQLAPNAKYLYKDPNPGILGPLFDTQGVIFPYTPNIETSYAAIYDKYDLVHSNYRGYFYRNSAVNEISVRGTFTAQDTSEAEYLLAVIHFFRSVTKMFYGQDDLRGAPPPLVYLSGYGDFQFNEHPCLVSSFSYSLPSDVDYIRATMPLQYGQNLLTRRTGYGLFDSVKNLSDSLNRLFNSNLPPGALPGNGGVAGTLTQDVDGTERATYVPTKMEINITLLPTNTRADISQQFSLKEFANGALIKGGFW
jgi:hypothetical protein